MKSLQIVKKIFLEKAGASQVVNVFLLKMQILDIINGLVKTAGNGISTAAWILTIENVEYNAFFGVGFEITLHHGQFI